MKSLILILLIIGIIFISVGYIKTNQQCPPPVVEFRYIPKTFDEEQSMTQPLLSMYGRMFKEPTAWQKVNGFKIDTQNQVKSSL